VDFWLFGRWVVFSCLNHPDHRAAGDAALDAIFPSARTRHIFPELLSEGLEPRKCEGQDMTHAEAFRRIILR
jgi:LmbE family N-acetylglucosaminyl deacetylase